MTTEDFTKQTRAIRDHIEHDVHHDDVSGMMEKLNRLSSLIGLSAELKAFATKEVAMAELIALAKHEHKKYSPMILKKIIESEAAPETERLVYADRLNAGLTHAIEAIRTILSTKKEEYRQSQYQNT